MNDVLAHATDPRVEVILAIVAKETGVNRTALRPEVTIQELGIASITPGFIKGWEALRVLSPGFCRPFSRDRAGLVMGEGAAVFRLEERDRARARGAVIHAEFLGFGMSADAADLTALSAEGASAAIEVAMSNSFAFGGLNAVLVVGRA